ncbi:hypothetical protein ACHJH3_08690 [Campylobacter sp. MOP7]|uniref:hypothetical protein n=1 Tax=Campylobacter canis TaxID=3378588 RepID=UPI00387EE34C
MSTDKSEVSEKTAQTLDAKEAVEGLNSAISLMKSDIDSKKNNFDTKYEQANELFTSLKELKAQIESLLESTQINDQTVSPNTAYSSEKVEQIKESIQSSIQTLTQNVNKNFLGKTATAADSDKLDGLAASGYRKSADSYTKVQTDAKILGVDQTWKNLTAQRQAGIIYTNSSSKPIVVSIYIKPQAQGNRLSASLEVSSLIVAFSDITPMNNTPLVSTLTAIVPAAATYRLSANLPLEITRWAELS